MSKTVEVIPQVGIVLDGRTIRLEDTRADVELALGSPGQTRWRSLYYFDSELRLDLDEEDCVEFIELLGGPEGQLQPVVFGLEAFQAAPEAVLELLREKNGPDFEDAERGYCYVFKTLSVGLYRPSVPENVADMIEEAEAEGEPLDEDEIEYETHRTRWASIGIGREYYYGYG